MFIVLAAAAIAASFIVPWFIPLVLFAIVGIALLAVGAKARVGETARLRRFRSRAGSAAPDTETLSGE